MATATIMTMPVANRLFQRTKPQSKSGLLRMALIPTTWGDCGVIWRSETPEGWDLYRSAFIAQVPASAALCRIMTPGWGPAKLRAAMQKIAPAAAEVLPDGRGRFPQQLVPEWFTDMVWGLQGYYSNQAEKGDIGAWDDWKPRLDWNGMTDFQRKVLDFVARIPRGQVKTYGQVATLVGKPGAARAVGAVMRTNPWPILVPCHRVVGAAGELTGYSGVGKLTTKKRLLEMEKAL